MIWQACAIFMLLFFYGVYGLKASAQRRRGIKTNHMAQKKSGALFYTELLLSISTYGVVGAEVLSIIFNTRAFPRAVRMLGVALAVLGNIVFALAVWTMRDSWRAGIAQDDKTEMVTAGIYSLSRNPAFLGFDLVYIGILLMFFNWVLCVFTLLPMVMLHLQILQEEAYLASAFGGDYLAYKRSVGRYFGKR